MGIHAPLTPVTYPDHQRHVPVASLDMYLGAALASTPFYGFKYREMLTLLPQSTAGQNINSSSMSGNEYHNGAVQEEGGFVIRQLSRGIYLKECDLDTGW